MSNDAVGALAIVDRERVDAWDRPGAGDSARRDIAFERSRRRVSVG